MRTLRFNFQAFPEAISKPCGSTLNNKDSRDQVVTELREQERAAPRRCARGPRILPRRCAPAGFIRGTFGFLRRTFRIPSAAALNIYASSFVLFCIVSVHKVDPLFFFGLGASY